MKFIQSELQKLKEDGKFGVQIKVIVDTYEDALQLLSTFASSTCENVPENLGEAEPEKCEEVKPKKAKKAKKAKAKEPETEPQQTSQPKEEESFGELDSKESFASLDSAEENDTIDGDSNVEYFDRSNANMQKDCITLMTKLTKDSDWKKDPKKLAVAKKISATLADDNVIFYRNGAVSTEAIDIFTNCIIKANKSNAQRAPKKGLSIFFEKREIFEPIRGRDRKNSFRPYPDRISEIPCANSLSCVFKTQLDV